ncbi:MAG: DDE-type integrase/transposase/recombinase [Candidatus Binatia bacterium]
MNRVSKERRAAVVAALCEGVSVSATARLTKTNKRTVLRILAEVGKACAEYQDKAMRNLKCRRIQADETWSFVAMKQKTAKRHGVQGFGVGDVWTWTAIDADSKIIPCWYLSESRDGGAAYEFMSDLESRLAHRVQLTTDGHKAYLDAVDSTFGIGIDYAMLVKLYGKDPNEAEHRYSPAVCIGTERTVISGEPDPDHISTSYVERSNLSIRMHTRRFTRLTNAFSKKIENHAHAVALFFMFYNFARIHQTLRVTPAMEAKMALPNGKETAIADHVWTVEEIVALAPEPEAPVVLK